MVNVIGLLWGLASITPRFPAQKLDSLTNSQAWPDAKSPSEHLSRFKRRLSCLPTLLLRAAE